MQIQFKAKYLNLLCAFVAKQDVRYYLNGIYVEPHKDGGAILVATDGRSMLCIRDTSAQCSDPKIILINRDALRHSKKGEPTCYVDTESSRLKICDQVGERYLQPNDCFINGKFPDFRKVMPDFKSLKDVLPSALDAGLLQRVGSIFAASASHRTSALRLWTTGVSGAQVIVQFMDVPEAFAILMPLREDNLTHEKLVDLGNKFSI